MNLIRASKAKLPFISLSIDEITFLNEYPYFFINYSFKTSIVL
jgi:hypothetical protein